MVIQHNAIFNGYGAPPAHCLPVDNGYPVIQSNPYCNNNWGWLNEGECGCIPDSPGWDAAKKGCSVKCLGKGENDCPKCKKPFDWALWGSVGLGALAAFYLIGRK